MSEPTITTMWMKRAQAAEARIKELGRVVAGLRTSEGEAMLVLESTEFKLGKAKALVAALQDIIKGQLPFDPTYDGPSDLVGRKALADSTAAASAFEERIRSEERKLCADEIRVIGPDYISFEDLADAIAVRRGSRTEQRER